MHDEQTHWKLFIRNRFSDNHIIKHPCGDGGGCQVTVFVCVHVCRNNNIVRMSIKNICIKNILGCTWYITSWWCICWNLFRRSWHWYNNDIRNESRRYTSWIKKVLFLVRFLFILFLFNQLISGVHECSISRLSLSLLIKHWVVRAFCRSFFCVRMFFLSVFQLKFLRFIYSFRTFQFILLNTALDDSVLFLLFFSSDLTFFSCVCLLSLCSWIKIYFFWFFSLFLFFSAFLHRHTAFANRINRNNYDKNNTNSKTVHTTRSTEK